ncbi:MAG: DUF6089 family protein [Bacteroidia bacterium]|jgi:hypothetical protein|nr:DUF6089 family protein [Bacteroidia bacterium]
MRCKQLGKVSAVFTAILVGFFIVNPFNGSSQNIEFGLFLGASNYYGDLSNNSIVPSQTHFSGSFIGRYNVSERFAVKGFVGYGRISGSDENSTDAVMKSRNLSFFSDIIEASAHLEYNLVKNSTAYSANTKKVIPYLFVGVGLFNFNPKAEYGGQVYELQPLGTEGQGSTVYNDRTKYALTQLCIPFGIGLRKKLGNNFSFGIELGARYTRTNYLDDIGGTYAAKSVIKSTHGDIAEALSDRSGEINPDGAIFAEGQPRSMKAIDLYDMYFMGGITFTYIFPNAGMRCPRF